MRYNSLMASWWWPAWELSHSLICDYVCEIYTSDQVTETSALMVKFSPSACIHSNQNDVYSIADGNDQKGEHKKHVFGQVGWPCWQIVLFLTLLSDPPAWYRKSAFSIAICIHSSRQRGTAEKSAFNQRWGHHKLNDLLADWAGAACPIMRFIQ